MSQTLEIQLPDEVFLGLQQDREHLAAEMRVAAAVKWYEMGLLTQGKAAEVAGLSRASFIDELGHHRVSPFQESAEQAIETVKDFSP